MDERSIDIGIKFPMSGAFIEKLHGCCTLARMKSLLLVYGGLLFFAASSSADDAARSSSRDHERAQSALSRGEYVPLQRILDDAERRQPGRLVEVELDEEDHEYEIEILRADGVVIELEYDARTGDLLNTEVEDD